MADSKTDCTLQKDGSVYQHELFDATDADLTVQSCDGALLKLHRKNLEVATGAFLKPEFANEDVVELPEPVNVLELIFQYVYPRFHPRLDNIAFDLLLAVADAVEKYEVFAAMNICEVRLLQAIPDHATEVHAHAFKYKLKNKRLLDEASRYCIALPLSKSIVAVPRDNYAYTLGWIDYYEAWKDIFSNWKYRYFDPHSYKPMTSGCDKCVGKTLIWIRGLEIMPLSKLTKELEYGHPKYECHSSRAQDTAKSIKEAIKDLRPFTYFLDQITQNQ